MTFSTIPVTLTLTLYSISKRYDIINKPTTEINVYTSLPPADN